MCVLRLCTFPSRLMAEITRNRNGHTRNLTPRNTTRDPFVNKYIHIRELIFLLIRDVSLERLCSNSLIASATTTSRNLTPAPGVVKLHHIKLFPQCDKHLFFSVPGVRNHLPHVMRMLSVTNFQNGGQVKEGN